VYEKLKQTSNFKVRISVDS